MPKHFDITHLLGSIAVSYGAAVSPIANSFKSSHHLGPIPFLQPAPTEIASSSLAILLSSPRKCMFCRLNCTQIRLNKVLYITRGSGKDGMNTQRDLASALHDFQNALSANMPRRLRQVRGAIKPFTKNRRRDSIPSEPWLLRRQKYQVVMILTDALLPSHAKHTRGGKDYGIVVYLLFRRRSCRAIATPLSSDFAHSIWWSCLTS